MNCRLLVTGFAVSCATCLLPGPAVAQSSLFPGLDQLFGRVEGGAIVVGGGLLLERNSVVSGSLSEVAFEVAIDATPCQARSSAGTCVKRSTPDFVLAIGISYLAGFGTGDTVLAPPLDLRGSVLTLPTISLFIVPEGAPTSKLFPYFGPQIGLAKLWGARAVAPDLADTSGVSQQVLAVESQTLHAGLTVGVIHEPSNLFLELAIRHRRFRSLDWKAGDAVQPPPGNWPRDLNLSDMTIRLGLQFWTPG